MSNASGHGDTTEAAAGGQRRHYHGDGCPGGHRNYAYWTAPLHEAIAKAMGAIEAHEFGASNQAGAAVGHIDTALRELHHLRDLLVTANFAEQEDRSAAVGELLADGSIAAGHPDLVGETDPERVKAVIDEAEAAEQQERDRLVCRRFASQGGGSDG